MLDVMLLRSVQIFKGLTDDELSRILCCCKEMELKGNTVIFRENEDAEFLYTLLHGNVAIRYKLPYLREHTEHVIASIGVGGTFGWSSLSPDGRYRFSAYCLGDCCKTLRCDRESLLSVLERNHTIGYKVMKNLAEVAGSRFVALQDEVARRDGHDFIDGW